MKENQYAQFNRFELLIPEQAVKDCYHQGDCEDDCKFWVDKVIALNNIDPNLIKEELKEYGAWEDEELNDDRQNWIRILWLGAGNIQDDIFEANK